MSEAATLLFIYAETPLHPGTGSNLGVVDLPVQRERTTQFPTIQGSSIKGVLRAQTAEETAKELFGQQERAGLISFSDARILLFPVRSMAGVFCWITCPAVLARLHRDLTAIGHQEKLGQILEIKENEAQVTNITDVVVPMPGGTDQIALEEFLFKATKTNWTTNVARWLAQNALPYTEDFSWWREKLQKSLVILHDNDFRDFVTTATEIVARTKLNPETKTVENRALWYQEFLPGETVFYTISLAQGQNREITGEAALQKFKDLKIDRIQIGGDETTGKGFCKIRYL